MLVNSSWFRVLAFVFISFVGGCATTAVEHAPTTVTAIPRDEGWCRLGGGRTYRVYTPACMPTQADRAVDYLFDAHRQAMERVRQLESSGAPAGEVRAQLEGPGRTLDRFHQVVRDACAVSSWECRTACEYLDEMHDLTRRYNAMSSRYTDEANRWYQLTEDADVPLMCAAEAARRVQRR